MGDKSPNPERDWGRPSWPSQESGKSFVSAAVAVMAVALLLVGTPLVYLGYHLFA